MRDDWLSPAWKVLVARGVVGIVFGVVAQQHNLEQAAPLVAER
jgi:hypothetical protein